MQDPTRRVWDFRSPVGPTDLPPEGEHVPRRPHAQAEKFLLSDEQFHFKFCACVVIFWIYRATSLVTRRAAILAVRGPRAICMCTRAVEVGQGF